MPHFLRVKQEHVNKFGGLFPYGPFNRIIYEPSGIYLESGFLDLVMFGFYNFKTYTPGKIEINKNITPIVGLMVFNFKRRDSSILGFQNICSFKEIEMTRNFCISEIRESKALNCVKKTNTVIMIDPRGAGKECTTVYIPSIPSKPANIGTSLVEQMQYIEIQAINTTLAETGGSEDLLTGSGLISNFLSSGFRDTCFDREAVEKEYKGQNKIFCPNDILYKKYCQQKFPPSLYTGKLKLYIQSIYGGNYVDYRNEQGSFISMLYVGPNFNNIKSQNASRKTVFGRGSHILHTDSLGNYYLINTATWGINPLVPTFQGTLLKRYLRSLNLTPSVYKDAYEAYILTTCLPTRISYVKNKPYHTYGQPLDFGWHSNWEGTTLAQVAIKRTDTKHRVSTLVTIDISSSGISTLYEEEIARKKENLILQEERKKLDYVQIPGVYPIYVTNTKVVTVEISAGIFDHCFSGDIEDGEWSYAVLGYNPAINSDEYKQAKKESEEKNKSFGGLPYSEQFYLDLPDFFEVSISSERQSEPWQERHQSDKMFVWDTQYQDFRWDVGCDPKTERNPSCPQSTLGTYPVYCWFSKNGTLQIVNYTNRLAGDVDSDIISPEGICGTGSDSYSSFGYTNGFISGFVMSTGNGLTGPNDAISYENKGSMSVIGGSWSRCWEGACGPSEGCDGNSAEPGIPPLGGCFSLFFTSWRKWQKGSGNSEETKKDSNITHFSCFVVPVNDCEGAFLGITSTSIDSLKTTTKTYNNTLTVAKQESGIVGPFDPNETKWTIPQMQGWLTCDGLWFCFTWGDVGGCEITTPEYFSYCYQGINLQSISRKVLARKWGPSGKDTPVAISKVRPSGNPTTVKITTENQISGYFESCFIGQDGKKINLSTLSSSSSDLEDPYIPGVGNFYQVLRFIDTKWPYAGSGNILDSLQTVQNLKIIHHPHGITKDPKDFPYEETATRPVGYV